MYNALLVTHSWLRWAVLIFGLIALIAAIKKHVRKDLTPDRSSLGLLISADLQLLVGFSLFFVSPYFAALTQAPKAAMGDAGTRFFAARARARHDRGDRAGPRREDHRERSQSPFRYRTVAIVFALALVIILVVIPWPFLSHARPLARW